MTRLSEDLLCPPKIECVTQWWTIVRGRTRGGQINCIKTLTNSFVHLSALGISVRADNQPGDTVGRKCPRSACPTSPGRGVTSNAPTPIADRPRHSGRDAQQGPERVIPCYGPIAAQYTMYHRYRALRVTMLSDPRSWGDRGDCK